jgi:acetyl-CoA C-acetyltransferase
VAKARELGIPEHRWVYLHGCADAHDHWYISDRHNFYTSPAMRVVGRETMEMAGRGIEGIDRFDLYSCFPSAVQIACREMGIPQDDPRGLTVTGGLPYFGGPGNNYVTHSIAQMDPAIYQATIDADKGPAVAEVANGAATVETYTVMHDRKGPSYAILFGRLGDGRRFMANTPDDPKLLHDMVARDLIGEVGRVTHDDGRNIFVPG